MDELEKQTEFVVPVEQLSTVPKVNLGPLPEPAAEPETATKVKPRIKLKVEKTTATKVTNDSKIDFLTKRIKALEKEVFLLKNKTEEDFKDIDQNLEENFTNLYQEIYQIQDSLPKTEFSNRVIPKVGKGKKQKIKENNTEKFTKNFFGEKIGGAIINASKNKKKNVVEQNPTPLKETKDTTTKISSVSRGDVNDILYNIYDLMKKNADDDKLQRELDADYAEQRKRDKELKHKELLEAIQSLSIGGDFKEQEEIEKGTIGSLIETLIKTLGGLQAASWAKSLLGFGGGKAASGAASGSSFLSRNLGRMMAGESAAEIVAGSSSATAAMIFAPAIIGVAGMYLQNSRIRDAAAKGDIAGVEQGLRIMMQGESGPADESLVKEQAEAIMQQYAAEKTQNASTPASPSVSTPSTTPPATPAATPAPASPSVSTPSTTPSATPAPMPKATPAPATPKSDVLNRVVSENAKQKLDEDTAPAKPIVMNNSNVNGLSQNAGASSVPIGKVRDRDDTMGRLLSNSTRVV